MKYKMVTIPSPTSRIIARKMRLVSRYRKRVLDKAEILIRWGNTKRVNVQGLEINTREAIILAGDKPRCRELLRSKNIPVPTETETDFPVIGRPRKHMGGNDFYFCTNSEEVEDAKEMGAIYFSKYYPKKDEYRVHVAGGRVLLVSIKEGDKTQVIWNKKMSGFKFRHLYRHVWLDDKKLRKMCRKAKKAIKIVGLDFGAVDIMVDGGRGCKPFVISEINTAPSLSPLAIDKYSKFFWDKIHNYEEENDESTD